MPIPKYPSPIGMCGVKEFLKEGQQSHLAGFINEVKVLKKL